MAVGIDDKVLDKIRMERNSHDDCLFEVIKYWVSNSKKEPTQANVITAVRTIDHPDVKVAFEAKFNMNGKFR